MKGDGLVPGPAGKDRGFVMAKRIGRKGNRRWWYTICLGGRTWTEPQSCKWKWQIQRRAQRLIDSIPNHQGRRRCVGWRRRSRDEATHPLLLSGLGTVRWIPRSQQPRAMGRDDHGGVDADAVGRGSRQQRQTMRLALEAVAAALCFGAFVVSVFAVLLMIGGGQ
jgi:hypothetical protein